MAWARFRMIILQRPNRRGPSTIHFHSDFQGANYETNIDKGSTSLKRTSHLLRHMGWTSASLLPFSSASRKRSEPRIAVPPAWTSASAAAAFPGRRSVAKPPGAVSRGGLWGNRWERRQRARQSLGGGRVPKSLVWKIASVLKTMNPGLLCRTVGGGYGWFQG